MHLVQRPLWVLGSLVGVGGVLLELDALAHLQLAFVQPLLAAGVLILPLASHPVLDEPLSPRWFGWSALIVAGVMVLGIALPPTSRTAAPPEPAVLSLTVLVIVVYLLVRHVRTPVLLGVVAGVGFSGSVIFAKLLATPFGLLRVVELAPVLAALACLGFLAEMSALQRTSPTTIAPIILALTTVLPIVIGHAVLGERWPHPVLTVLGFALTVLPALWFVAHHELEAVAAPAPADRPLSHAEGKALPPTPRCWPPWLSAFAHSRVPAFGSGGERHTRDRLQCTTSRWFVGRSSDPPPSLAPDAARFTVG